MDARIQTLIDEFAKEHGIEKVIYSEDGYGVLFVFFCLKQKAFDWELSDKMGPLQLDIMDLSSNRVMVMQLPDQEGDDQAVADLIANDEE